LSLKQTRGQKEIVDISISEFLEKPKTVKESLKTYSVGVEFNKQDQTINPYFLGLWLGDGTAKSTNITTMDEEIKQSIYQEAHARGLFVNEYVQSTSNKSNCYHISSGRSYKKENSLLKDLQKLNLIDNKHIPKNYLIASKEQRLSLLAGLLDSDGYYSKNNNYFEITQKDKNFVDQIVFLAKSLGFSCSFPKERYTEEGWGPYYRINISGSGLEKIPTRIPRKKARERRQVKDALVSSFQLESLGEGNYYGFEIDGNHRYLLGDFQVTHNTSISRSIATALRRPLSTIFLAGVDDVHDLKGHMRAYLGAEPGLIMKAFIDAECSYPIVLLDEVDKAGASVSLSLLDVLDYEQNHSFRDLYIDLQFDISNALFICTANNLDTIHPALLDRVEVIEVGSYTEDDKIKIARDYLIPKIRKNYNLKINHFCLDRSVLIKLIRGYTDEPGIRRLEKLLEKLGRKITREVVEKKRTGKRKLVSALELEQKLGPPTYSDERMRNLLPGSVFGLAVSEGAGQVLTVESIFTEPREGSKPKLTVTGQPGVMSSESSSIVLSLIKSRAEELELDISVLLNNDIHINYPECTGDGVDGPSAGVTMFVALYTLLKGVRISRNITMTGEVNLRGEVGAIGGLREKILASYRKGKTKIIIPKGNEPELTKIPKYILDKLTVIPVSNITELLEACDFRESDQVCAMRRSTYGKSKLRQE
jgi:hypothetical protein